MKRWVVYAVAVLAAVAAAAWLSPAVEVRPTLAVVETRVGAAAVQWPRGVVSVWLWNDAGEVRLWPLG